MSKTLKNNSKTDQQSPPHFPFEDPPFRHSMGLLKIPESEWFEIFDLHERATQLIEKRKFLSSIHDEVFMTAPTALSASREVLNLMLEHLPVIRPDLYSLRKNFIKLEPHIHFNGEELSTDLQKNKIHPLDLAARLVQEDLVIMLPPDSKKEGWWLAAGSVAFPSRWSLKEKFGKTMDSIHAPVPLYKEQIQSQTNNFFNSMPRDEIFSRRNWSLHDNPSLRQDGTEPSSEKAITAKNAGDCLWLRVERQTLRKLKESDAILFTIRIHLRPLNQIANTKGAADRLSKALAALPTEMKAYKQTDTFSNSAQAYLNNL